MLVRLSNGIFFSDWPQYSHFTIRENVSIRYPKNNNSFAWHEQLLTIFFRFIFCANFVCLVSWNAGHKHDRVWRSNKFENSSINFNQNKQNSFSSIRCFHSQQLPAWRTPLFLEWRSLEMHFGFHVDSMPHKIHWPTKWIAELHVNILRRNQSIMNIFRFVAMPAAQLREHTMYLPAKIQWRKHTKMSFMAESCLSSDQPHCAKIDFNYFSSFVTSNYE